MQNAPIATGSIQGQLRLPPGTVAGGVRVSLSETSLATVTDSTGRFVFDSVPVGRYRLVVGDATHPAASRDIAIVAGARIDIEIVPDLDTPRRLGTIVVRATQPLHVIGHLNDVQGNVIYAGKKTEVLVMDSLRANMSQDVERQILGRVPGANFSETEGAGFPSNGVGFRGLDPTQSVEMNTRQNGIGLAADLYG